MSVAMVFIATHLIADVKNDGATINVESGTVLFVEGDLNNTTGSTITNNGTIQISDGTFDNNGSPTINGLVRISGSSGSIAGVSIFKDLEIDCSSSVDVIAGLNTFNDNLFIKRGNLVLGGGGSIAYGINANLEYNGTLAATAAAEFPPHNATYNPKTVTINNAAGVTLNVPRQVLYTLVLKSGNLNSGGNLVLASTSGQTAIVDDFSAGNPSSSVTGNIRIERYITNPPVVAFPGSHYHYIGSALDGATAANWSDDFSVVALNSAVNGTPVQPTGSCDPNELAPGSPYGTLYTYDESLNTTCYLQGWRVRTTAEPATRGKGFAAVIPSSGVIDQVGTYSDDDVTLSGTNTGAEVVHPITVTGNKSSLIVTNPFCAALDWDVNYANIGGASSDIDGNAYLYNPDGGTYVAYNNINQGFIGTSQAFFIRAKNSIRSSAAPSYNFTFDNAARVTSNNNTFFRQQPNYAFGYSINLTSPNSRTDQTLLVFDNNFTNDFDNGFDADKMMSDAGSPSLFTRMPDGYGLSIQALPINTNIITVPLALKPENTGVFQINFNELQALPGTMMVTLEDTKEQSFQDIRINNVYSFSADINDDVNRFLVHFTPQLQAAIVDATCAGVDGQIILNQTGGVEWNYTLINAANDTITTDVFTGEDTIRNLAPNTYTLWLSHISGYQTTETYSVNGVALVNANITASAISVEQNDMISFEATGDATTFNWNMGDGTIINNQSNVNHSYAQPGVYEVTLTASNNNCSIDNIIEITVNESMITSILNNEQGKLWAYHFGNKLFFKQTLSKENTVLNATLYNSLGQVVTTINNNAAHNQVITVPINNIAKGTYFLHADAVGKKVVKKIVITE